MKEKKDLAALLFRVLTFGNEELMALNSWSSLLFQGEENLRQGGIHTELCRGMVLFTVGEIVIGFGRTRERLGLEEMKILFEGKDHFINSTKLMYAQRLFADIVNILPTG